MNYAIIAAGEGSRLAQEGITQPKPLIELNGMPMIGRLIDIFVGCAATSVSVIVNEQMTQVREYVEQLGKTLPVPLHLVVKTTPSSMHSFYHLSRHFDGNPFCLTTVDTIFRQDDFERYIKAFQADSHTDGYMAVTDFVDDEKPLWVSTGPEGRITGFHDSRPQGGKYISGGIYTLTPKSLEILEACMANGTSRMRNFQRALVDAGLNLTAYPFKKIIDVDHAADIATAEKFIS